MDPATPAGLTLDLFDGRYAICRLGPGQPVPNWAWHGPLASVTRTPDELSVICAEAVVPATVEHVERGWRALRVAGPLDFGMVGVMAQLVAPLAEAGISILALATFDTDYLLVREPDLARAVAALRSAGHRVHAPDVHQPPPPPDEPSATP
jgi:hypothetical protein